MHLNVYLETRQELSDYFQNLQNVVPKRAMRKGKERQIKAEIFFIERYLKTLAYNDLLNYPIKLVQQSGSQSPDFIMNDCHGIEITEATDENYQNWLTSISGFSEPQMYNQTGYSGDVPEKMTVEEILASVGRKQLKIAGYIGNNPKICTCDLLIYENTEYPYLDQEVLFDMLVKKSIRTQKSFSKVSVISGDAILYAVNTATAQHLAIIR